MSRFVVINAALTVFCAVSPIVFFAGCGDSPEVPPATYGNVVKTLPVIAGAGEPFKFPFDDTTDHSQCKFDSETGELIKNLKNKDDTPAEQEKNENNANDKN